MGALNGLAWLDGRDLLWLIIAVCLIVWWTSRPRRP